MATGKITQIIGAVIDVEFPRESIPNVYEALKLKDRGFPTTEAIAAEVCSLPMNVEMTDADVQYIIATIRKFYGERA